MFILKLENILKIYNYNKKNAIKALNNINVTLPDNGLIFITGASGSGKSTLLNLIGLLDYPTDGKIKIDNKDTSKFRKKEIDYYRNTYLGFVFQEYNLLENFNVYSNIEIALALQKHKKNKLDVQNVLKSVGLEKLEKRKINELSGGQKQRVAIARALIKNPKIILADEPTGNLDSTNAEQVLEILKEISKEKLVIVITHNLEQASKFADRIIELKDGSIINDKIVNESEYSNNIFSSIRSRLPFKSAMLLAISNLNKKKIRFLITTLLLTLSFSTFGFFYMLTKFDINKTHAETLVNQNECRIEINKKIIGKNFTNASPVITFTSSELAEVKSMIENETITVNKAVENNFYLEIPFASERKNENNKNYSYYDFSPSYTLFIEYSEEKLNELKVIGRIPTQEHEIIINKVLADYIIHNGLTILENDKDNKLKEENYYPTNYSEIVNSNNKILYGTSYLVITGIIDEDMTKYEILKETLSDEMEINPTKTYEEFKTKYVSKLSEVIVPINFLKTLGLKSNNEIPIDFYKITYSIENKKVYPKGNSAILDKKLKIYDGEKNKEIDSLNENEVVISSTLLDDIYDNEYSDKLLNYIKTEKEKYENKVEKRNKEIEAIDKQLEINPDYEYTYPQELDEFDSSKLMIDFTKRFINEKELIGKKLSIEINDMYLRKQSEKTRNIGEFIIVGYSFDEINNYFSIDSILKEYLRENSETISIYFYDNNLKNLENIFEKFPSDNNKYVAKTAYTETFNNVETVVKNISNIASYFSIFALIFSTILFTLFAGSSINSNKRNIGILRALGAKISDIYKIFYLECFLMGIISIIMSLIVSNFSVIIANNLISTNLFINVKPIIFRLDVIYILLGVLAFTTIMSFIIPILKISKSRPINAINNK